MSALTRILGFLKPYRRDAVLSMAFLAAVVGLDLLEPRFVQIIIDQGIASHNMQLIFLVSLIMIGASVLSAVFAIVNTIFSVRVAQSFAADVRRELYHKIQSFSFGNLDDFQTGRLLVRLTSDVNQLQMVALISLRMLIRAPLMVVGSVAFMVTMNRQLSLMMFGFLSLTFLLTLVFVAYARPLFMGVQKRLDSLNQVLEENLSGIRVVKAFVRRDYVNRRFEEVNADLTAHSIRVAGLLSVLMPLMFLTVNLSTVAIIYFGGLQIIGGSFTTGELVAFISYVLSTMFPLTFLAIMAGQMSAANASAERIVEVLDAAPKLRDKSGAVALEHVKGRVAFEKVCFSYLQDCAEPVLKDVSLVAEPGQTVAILGATGSGKTSLIYLIPRFYDVTEGKITVDGVDVRDVTQDSLRSHIGISLQEPVLFSGTIRENIKYGRRDASDEEVVAAAKAAQAHEFILSFPEGYDTVIGQRGATLSGGQKQRIAIARALLVDPKILILDDSTSSVDVETEAKVQEALRVLMRDRTSFVIAQRISTVLSADKIVVLDGGRVAAEGTHAELMHTSPLYREIYESQLGDGGAVDE